MKGQPDKRLLISTFALIIFHSAGIIGMQTAHRELFLAMTPLNLLLSSALLLYNHKEYNNAFIVFICSIPVIGYLVEVAGVWSGSIFGHYWYDGALGWKIMDVPLVIGFNWMMLVYCAGIISNRIEGHVILKSAAGAILLVMLDLLIEQSAHRYHFWSWLYDIIPLQNYIAWFIVSFLFLIVFHSLKFNKENKLALILYITQLLFFVLLLAL
jgi:bisanhydrobacterioruberin hydratase